MCIPTINESNYHGETVLERKLIEDSLKSDICFKCSKKLTWIVEDSPESVTITRKCCDWENKVFFGPRFGAK